VEERLQLHAHRPRRRHGRPQELKQNWAADVRAHDAIEAQALHMADMLSAGIVQQFPGRFGDD
jgi:hypothetical protein